MISVPGADDDADARLRIGIARLADADDASVLEADVGFDDSPMVDDERVGDDRIDGAARAADLGLPHAVADHLAAAELHLFTIDGEILLDLDDEIGVGEAHAIAHCGTEHVRIGASGDRERHQCS